MRKEDKGVIIGQLAETVKQYGHFTWLTQLLWTQLRQVN